MAGNRIDIIERAAARLRRDAPSQKPVIDQRMTQPAPAPEPPAPKIVSLAPPGPSITPAPVTPPAAFTAPDAFVRTTPVLPQATVIPPAPVVPPPPGPGEAKTVSATGKTSRTVVLDTARLALAGTVDWTADRTPVMEELRLIKRRLLRRAFDRADVENSLSHLVMVTSAKPREGKTFAVTNLAISISLEEDYNVLLVDADIRRQALRQNLGLDASQGFVDLLLNPNLDMADVLLRTNIPRLTVLPAGTMSDRAPELLAGSRMRELIDGMARRYKDRIILFDTAPCLISSDAATLAAHVGQVVFVVEAEQTQQHEIIAALNLISACPDISLILNKAQPLATTSYGGYGVY
jgi:exopolysaccharide/PEP-CTERM locus tyrosine autokinase